MLRLRLKEGIHLQKFKDKFGFDFTLDRKAAINKLKEYGYLVETDSNLALTERGFYVSNTVISELV